MREQVYERTRDEDVIAMKETYRGHELEAVPFEDRFDLWIDGCEFMTSEYLPKCGTAFSVILAGREAIDDAIYDGILTEGAV